MEGEMGEILRRLDLVKQALLAPASEEEKLRLNNEHKMLCETMLARAREREFWAETELVIARRGNSSDGESLNFFCNWIFMSHPAHFSDLVLRANQQ